MSVFVMLLLAGDVVECYRAWLVLMWIELMEPDEAAFTPLSAEVVRIFHAGVVMDERKVCSTGTSDEHTGYNRPCADGTGGRALFGTRLDARRASFTRCSNDIDTLHATRETAANFLVRTDGEPRWRLTRCNSGHNSLPNVTHQIASLRVPSMQKRTVGAIVPSQKNDVNTTPC